jgi:hypothetical protein
MAGDEPVSTDHVRVQEQHNLVGCSIQTVLSRGQAATVLYEERPQPLLPLGNLTKELIRAISGPVNYDNDLATSRVIKQRTNRVP